MKFGVALGLLNPAFHLDATLEAERLGFESVWLPEHLIFTRDMSGSPFPGGDHPPVPPTTPLFDCFAYLCFLAGKTSRVRLGAHVYLLGLRHPFIAARAVQTLDLVSQGRAEVGIGAGWLRQEWTAAGLDPRTRGRRLDEAVAVCKRLWTEETVDLVGSHFELAGASCSIKPLQKPHPPIWIGANADVAIKRAARLGDCWYVNPHNSIATTERQLGVYKEALAEAGKPFPEEFPMRREVFVAETRAEALRLCGPYLAAKYRSYRDWGQHHEMPDDDGLAEAFDDLVGDRFLIGSPEEVAEQIVGLGRRLGVNHLVMSIQWAGMPPAWVLDTMRRLAEQVFPKGREALGPVRTDRPGTG